MSVVELIYRLGADSSKFSAEMKGASREVQKFQRRAESDLRKVGKAFVSMGGLATGMLAGLVNEAINTGSELSVMSDRTGVAVEGLSALGWAAEQAGVAEGQLERGLIRFNQTMQDVEEGLGDAAEMADRLGIQLRKSNGELRPQEELLSDIAEAVKNAGSSYEQAAIASEFFGRRTGPELLPLLKEGQAGIEALKDEAERLGIVFTDNAARASRKLKDDINLLRRRTSAYAVTLAADVVPVLNAYVGSMLDSADATKQNTDEVSHAATVTATLLKFVEGVRVSFVILGETLGYVAGSLTDFVVSSVKWLHELGKGVTRLVAGIMMKDVDMIRSAWSGTLAALEGEDEDFLNRQRAAWQGYSEDIENIVLESGARMLALENAAKIPERPEPEDQDDRDLFDLPDIPDLADDDGEGRGPVDLGFSASVSDAERELQRLQGIVSRELAAIETPAEEFTRRMDDLWTALGEGLLSEDRFIDIHDQLVQTLDPFGDLARQAEETSRLMAEAEWMQDLKQQAIEVRASVNGIDLATVAHLESLQELRDQGLISWGEYEMAVQQVAGAIEEAEEQTSVMTEAAQNAVEIFADSIIDFVVDPFNSSIEDMATNFIQQVTRMVLETAAQRAILLAFDAVSGGGASATKTAVKAATGFASGGYVSGPGTSTSDSIPALLSDGEYVMSARTTSRLGVGALDAINFGNAQGFAAGGLVGASGGASGDAGVEVIVVSSQEQAMQRYLNSRAGRRKIVQINYEEGERGSR